MIGNLTGSESWQQSGREEHAQGEAEYKAAQAKGYVEGTVDRLTGKKDAVVGAVTGDRQQEAAGQYRISVAYRGLRADSYMKVISVMTRARLSKRSTSKRIYSLDLLPFCVPTWYMLQILTVSM